MKKRYTIEEVESFESGSDKIVRVFNVYDSRYADWVYFTVWYNGNTVRCTSCQGQLVAMRSDCRHANAVKRYLKDNEK